MAPSIKHAIEHRMIPIDRVDNNDGNTGVVKASTVATASISFQLGIPRSENTVTHNTTPIAENGGFAFGLLALLAIALLLLLSMFLSLVVVHWQYAGW